MVALIGGMPAKCKLPLYEYGSKGVLLFYQAQLTPVVTYRDLQTDVFQSFKEIGNTVLFCLQLEKALVSESARVRRGETVLEKALGSQPCLGGVQRDLLW